MKLLSIMHNTAGVFKCCYWWFVCYFCLWSHPSMTWSGPGVWTRIPWVPFPWRYSRPAGHTGLGPYEAGQADPSAGPNRSARSPFCLWADCTCASPDRTSWPSYVRWSDTDGREHPASSTPEKRTWSWLLPRIIIQKYTLF